MARQWRFDWSCNSGSDRRMEHIVEARSEDDARRMILAKFKPHGSFESFNDLLRLPDVRFGEIVAAATAPSVYAWRSPSQIPPRQWLYGHQLQRGLVHITAAPGVVGKTSYRIGTALSLVTGRPLLGQTVWDGPKRAWLWNLEDSPQHLERLIQAACIHHGVDQHEIEGRLHVDTALGGRPLRLGTMTDDGLVIDPDLIDALIDQIRAARIDYLNVDPFVSAHGGMENDNGTMDEIVKAWGQVAFEADCAIDLTMHTGKIGAGEVTTETVRGAKSITDAARSVMVLNRMSEEEANRFGIGALDRRAYFRTHDDKPNHAPSTTSASWFRFVSVDLGNGGLAMGDSVGVVEPWTPTDPMDGVTADVLAQVQAAIAGGEWRESVQASAWAGYAVATVVGLDAANKAEKQRISAMLRRWIKDGALIIVERRDPKKREDRKFIEVPKSAPPEKSGAGQSGESGAPAAP